MKHFWRKEQDRLDEQAMLEAPDELVPTGDLTTTERVAPWRQITNVTVRKRVQYVDGAPNILVVESSSESLEEMATSAVNEYNDEVLRANDALLLRVNGIMLVNTRSTGFGSMGPRNVGFRPTSRPAVPLSESLSTGLASIRLG